MYREAPASRVHMHGMNIENVPPEEYRISNDANKVNPDCARMVGHEREVPRSELIDMGFDKDLVYSLATTNESYGLESDEEISRRNKTDDYIGSPQDESQATVMLREAYIRVDRDGDGRSELLQVMTAGDELLSAEEVDRQPFHVICPSPLPHKHFGMASAEKVMDIQDINTTLLRQTLDNLYHSNNPQHAVWEMGIGDHTLDDLLSTEVGSIKRFARPVAESYSQITVPFTAKESFPMISYWEGKKKERTGIAEDTEGLSPEALKNIQSSVMAQANDQGKMKQEAVARIFAETGFKTLMLHIHELCNKHQDREKIVKLRGEYVPVKPTEWNTRYNCTVNVGLGMGSKEVNLLHLEAIWGKQRELIEAGGFGSMVTVENVYNTAEEIVKNSNRKDPQRYFTKITTEQFMQMQQQQQQEGENNEMQQLAQAAMQLEQQKMQLDYQEKSQKLMQRQQEMEANFREKEAKLNLSMQELELKRQQEANRQMEAIEAIQNQLTEMELKYQTDIPGSKV